MAKKVANQWRGERELVIGDHRLILSCTMEQMVEVFSVMKSETLDDLYKKLASRDPTLIQEMLICLAPENGADFWEHVNGLTGLNAAYTTIISVLSGLTPEEERDLEKKQQAELDENQNGQIETIVSQILSELGLNKSPSEDG